MILTTIVGAFRIAFCEMSSYSLLSIFLNRGGVPVKNDVNGLIFDANAPTDKYCKRNRDAGE